MVVKYGGTWLRKVGILNLLIISVCLTGISCSALKLPDGVTGSLFYRDPDSGAKGGLKVVKGKFTPWAKIPFIDEDGNVIGEFEVEAAK